MARMDTQVRTVVSSPRWKADFGDPEFSVEHFPAKLDAGQFVDRDQVVITTSAIAAQNATTVTINAIVFTGGYIKIPKGTTIVFGGSKVAVLSADYTGGTTLNVNALPTALASGDVGYYLPGVGYSAYPGAPGSGSTRLSIPSGTFVGRTYAERDAGVNFGPAAASDDEFFLTLFDVLDANINPNVEFYKHGRAVKENYLPGWTRPVNVTGGVTLPNATAILALLRSKYRCIKGVD